jgi:phosphatidylserine/phosphatidylglycerophosphate/cardiolipin synthase-like enzyme
MTRVPQALAVLLAIALTAVAAPHARAQDAPRAYFSPNGGGAEAVAAMVDAATSTVDVAMYSITTNASNPIWPALQRAVARNVRVRVLLDQATGSNKSKADALGAIGVHVFGVGSTTLHEKYAIVDAGKPTARLSNGSANWSLGAMTRYSENTVLWGRNDALISSFQTDFDRLLLTKGRPISVNAAQHKVATVLPLVPPGPRGEEALFSSANTGATTIVADRLIQRIAAATSSVYIDVAHFNSKSVAAALIKLHRDKPQVKLEVLLDLGSFSASISRAKELERAGIPVRYKTYSLVYLQPRAQLMHHKTLIVDEKRVVSGSYNWSDTAEKNNYENVVDIDGSSGPNAALVASYVAEHRKLWDLNRDVYARFRAAMLATPTNAAIYKKIIPVHFDTPYFNTIMTLTRAEITPVRAVAFAAGIVERKPDGSTKYHNDATYLDREAKTPYSGNVQGKFLDANAVPPPVTTNVPTPTPTPNGNGGSNGLVDGLDAPPGQ